MTKKGISPLIAAVFLIAFTIAIAGFIAPWVQNTVRMHTDETTESTNAGCIYATFNAEDATFNASGNNKLIFDIESSGTKDTYIKQITVTAMNGSRETFTSPENFTGTLVSGDEISVYLTLDEGLIANISKIRVMSSDCPQNADEIKGEEIVHYK